MEVGVHKDEIERLIKLATVLADRDGHIFLVYLLRMAFIENQAPRG